MPPAFSPLTHLFIWLAGASAEALQQCAQSEQRKYVAFGATVLVPSLFGIVAAGYAVATLTDRWWIIAPVALLWSFIILTIDRALLATYRAHQPLRGKLVQFTLRFGVAVLMGLTISHPLTLLLFRDTIGTITEQSREADVQRTRAKFRADKATLEAQASGLDQQLVTAREKWTASFGAGLLPQASGTAASVNASPAQAAQSSVERQIAQAQAPLLARLQELDREIEQTSAKAAQIQAELNRWQAEFEREVDGSRSGKGGIGPRAKSIQDDQLAWRRDETKRLSTLLTSRTRERDELRAQSTQLAQTLMADAAASAKSERTRIERQETLRQTIAEQQAGSFVKQQDELRAVMQQQVDGLLSQTKAVRADLARLDGQEQARIAAILAEPRRDLLHQTSALHQLFDDEAVGGGFALTTYIVLTLLFLLIDTIPLMVKFFAVPGPYDDLIHQQETTSRRRHQAQLQPLQQALEDDAERRRARATLLEREADEVAAFSEQVRTEQQAIDALRQAGHHEEATRRALALNQRARWFYDSAAKAQAQLASPAPALLDSTSPSPEPSPRSSEPPASPASPTSPGPAKPPLIIDNEPTNSAPEAPQQVLARLKAKEKAFTERLARERQALAKCEDDSEREDRLAELEEQATAFQAELQAEWEDYCASNPDQPDRR